MKTTNDPWSSIICCRYGNIFLHNDHLLTAVVNGHPLIAAKLRSLACCLVYQSGKHDELTAMFDVADLSQVATVLVPRWQPMLSDKQLVALVERRRGRRSK